MSVTRSKIRNSAGTRKREQGLDQQSLLFLSARGRGRGGVASQRPLRLWKIEEFPIREPGQARVRPQRLGFRERLQMRNPNKKKSGIKAARTRQKPYYGLAATTPSPNSAGNRTVLRFRTSTRIRHHQQSSHNTHTHTTMHTRPHTVMHTHTHMNTPTRARTNTHTHTHTDTTRKNVKIASEYTKLPVPDVLTLLAVTVIRGVQTALGT
ncbi:hypothetical protein EVAR_41375_1 [Eumeta japonica]|uniref:Uncharacterized protein n=1 Tax=Eumeta variegata TaxID=151549 RepID=A0A4C1X1E9_EUMVA|nr:hypothetical protein EVAR_41375_1 [Eumeta japonica]